MAQPLRKELVELPVLVQAAPRIEMVPATRPRAWCPYEVWRERVLQPGATSYKSGRGNP